MSPNDIYPITRRLVLLNGQYVTPADVDPRKHKFVGMFRPPANPLVSRGGSVLCPRGDILTYRHESDEHYMRGCADVLQYINIEQLVAERQHFNPAVD